MTATPGGLLQEGVGDDEAEIGELPATVTTGATVYLFQGLGTRRGDRPANDPTATPTS